MGDCGLMLNRNEDVLNFDAMDAFMTKMLSTLKEHGGRAVRVFPPDANVLISFSERVANEVVCIVLYCMHCSTHLDHRGRQVGEYIVSLLERAREISSETFLKANAASFREAWRMVDTIVEVSKQRKESTVSVTQAEDVV